MDRVYFDNAATSFPKAPGLGKVMADYIENSCVNINRTESSVALENFDFLYSLRENLCNLYNYHHPECVIFTKNVTEALNWVIKGTLSKEDHVVVSSMEHNAVMRPLIQIGCAFDRIPADEFGVCKAENAERLFKNNTKALILSVCNNVFGSVQPFKELCALAKSHGCMVFLDAAQASPFVDIDMTALGVDAVCFTGHKSFLGPQGTGGFIIKRELALSVNPLISGGTGSHSDSENVPDSLPDRLTPGTENLVGLRGLSYAVDYVLKYKKELETTTAHNTELLYKALEKIPQLKIKGPGHDMPRTSVVSVVSESCDISNLASYLQETAGIESRVGLHCSPSSHKAMGTFPSGTLRFSAGPFTKESEIDLLVCEIEKYFKEASLKKGV